MIFHHLPMLYSVFWSFFFSPALMLLTTCHFPLLEKWCGTAGRTYFILPPLWYFQITTIFPFCSCYGRRVCILSSSSCCFQAISDSIKLNESQCRTYIFWLCSLRTWTEFKSENTHAVWSFFCTKWIPYLLHHLKTDKIVLKRATSCLCNGRTLLCWSMSTFYSTLEDLKCRRGVMQWFQTAGLTAGSTSAVHTVHYGGLLEKKIHIAIKSQERQSIMEKNASFVLKQWLNERKSLK